MAQRKSPPSGKPVAKKGPTGPAGKPSGAAERKSPSGGRGPATKPPARKGKGKSIVNQRQTPWGLIAATAAVVLFAAGVVVAVIVTQKGDTDSADRYRLPEVAAAKSITGVKFHVEPNHTHITEPEKYDTTPPTGGNHSPIWADCSGTVYKDAIANENAVHMLEHGAVWITYKPGLPASQIAELTKLVDGVDRMAMSPYPGLKTNISLQAWGYQLFVNSASDPRINDFIAALRFSPDVTPENSTGVTCADPAFKTKPSTFGHPIFSLG